jgi:glycosyltransferase involved in cell wall biosynthesis
MTPRVVLLRGTAANPWELRPWELLQEEGAAEVELVVPPDNLYDTSIVRVPTTRVRTVGGVLPRGLPKSLLLKAVGQRHVGLEQTLRDADIVHAAELGYWFSWQAARLKSRLGFRLALTVWETLPFGNAYRNIRTRRYRREVREQTDLYLAATDRARDALLLEGAPEDRIRVSPPGVDVDRFQSVAAQEHTGRQFVLSVGRLVWEKGHQDVLRAVALLRSRTQHDVGAIIVGVGPEERRLRAVAHDLGIDDAVEFRGFVPHDEVPIMFASAACLVLASLPTPYWEEQFGMVLAEAMAARLPVIASASGAIPEVLAGYGTLFMPGDWPGLAKELLRGPLADPVQERPSTAPNQLARYTAEAAAARVQEAYGELLGW